MGQHLSDSPRDIAIVTFDLAGDGPSRRYGSSSSICTPSLKFVGLSVRIIWRTSGLNIMSAWWLWPLHLTLKLVLIIARGVGNLSTNFGVSRTVRSLLIGQHLSDASRDHATLTIDLGGHGACWWCGSSLFILRLCTNFEVRRPSLSEDMTHFLSQHKSAWWPWPLTFDFETGTLHCPYSVDNLPTNFGVSRTFPSRLCRPTPARRVTWPCVFDLWPWRSQRLALMRGFVIYLCT